MRTLRIETTVHRGTLVQVGLLCLATALLTACSTTGGAFARLDYVSARVNGRLFDSVSNQYVPVLAVVERPNAILDIVSLLRKAETTGKELPPEKVLVTDTEQAWLRIECKDKDGFHTDCDLREGNLVTIRNKIYRLPSDFHLDRDVGMILQRYDYLDPSLKLSLKDEGRKK
jgi:hypothetical protein